MAYSLSEFRGYPFMEYTIEKKQFFFKECPLGQKILEGYAHSKEYTSHLSFEHAQVMADNDRSSFIATGQSIANSTGTCVVNPDCLKETLVPDNYIIRAITPSGVFLNGMSEPYTLAQLKSASPLPAKLSTSSNILPAYDTKHPHSDPSEVYTTFFESAGGIIRMFKQSLADCISEPNEVVAMSPIRNWDSDDSIANTLETLHFENGHFFALSMQKATKEAKARSGAGDAVIIGGLIAWLAIGLFGGFKFHKGGGGFWKRYDYISGGGWYPWYLNGSMWVMGSMILYSLISFTTAKTSSGSNGRAVFLFYNNKDGKVYHLGLTKMSQDGYRAPWVTLTYHPESNGIYVAYWANRTYRTGITGTTKDRTRHGWEKLSYDEASSAAPVKNSKAVFYSTGMMSRQIWINTPGVLGYINTGYETLSKVDIIGTINLTGFIDVGNSTAIRTTRDVSNPNICYISSDTKIVSYNATTGAWTLIREIA